MDTYVDGSITNYGGPQFIQSSLTGTFNFRTHEEPESRPQPSSTVPFGPDPDYVDRGDILNRVEELLSAPAGRVALVGIGGVGKSQLAIEYSYRTRDTSPSTWVFWVHAANTARFQESYKILADRVKLPGRDNAPDILQSVYNWLSNPANGKWLMILDNSDDHRVFFDQIQQPDDASSSSPETSAGLAKFVPQAAHGSILITSRDRAAAFRLTGRHKNIIDVNPMDQATSLSLLRTKLGSRFDEQHAAELADELDYIPLAITQAAAYICQRTPSYSVKQYVAQLRHSNRNQSDLLNYDAGDVRRDASASSSNSVLLTWQISFEQIRRERSSAADLLSFMSLCDRQGIPQNLLRKLYRPPSVTIEVFSQRRSSRFRFWRRQPKMTVSSYSQGEYESALLRVPKPAYQAVASNRFGASAHNETESGETHELDDDLDVLGRYSLIVENADGGSFGLHRLVQLATRQWLNRREEIEQWKEKYTESLNTLFPSGDFGTWDACRILLPHALTMFDQPPSSKKWLGPWALVAHRVACYAVQTGDNSVAERILVKVVRVGDEIFGQHSIQRLSSIHLLGIALFNLEKLVEAENLTRKSLSGFQKVFGNEHMQMLRIENLLSEIEERQGKVEEAYERQRRISEVLRRSFGEDHMQTIRADSVLSSILLKQGKFAEAQRTGERVLSWIKKTWGEDHPLAQSAKRTIARSRGAQGRYEEAEKLLREVLKQSEIILGKEHPSTLSTLHILALSLSSQGRNEEALNAYLTASQGCERVLGSEHSYTLQCAEDYKLLRLEMERQIEAPQGQREVSSSELGAQQVYDEGWSRLLERL